MCSNFFENRQTNRKKYNLVKSLELKKLSRIFFLKNSKSCLKSLKAFIGNSNMQEGGSVVEISDSISRNGFLTEHAHI